MANQSDIQAQLDTVNANIASITAQIADLQGQLTAGQEQAATLQAELDTFGEAAKIAAYTQAQIDAINTILEQDGVMLAITSTAPGVLDPTTAPEEPSIAAV